MARHEISLLKHLTLVALCAALPALGIAADASLYVCGAAQHELRLDLVTLRQLPAQDSDRLATVCQSGAQVGAGREYRGVRPSNVLDQAGLDVPGHQDTRHSYMVVRNSRDGYAVVFSWGELRNSEAGDKILIAYQKNGPALGPGEGPLVLVSTSDLRSGLRHVKRLDGSEVARLSRGPLVTPWVASAAVHVHEAQYLHLVGDTKFMAHRLTLGRLADRFQ